MWRTFCLTANAMGRVDYRPRI